MAKAESPIVKLLGPSLLKKVGTSVSTEEAFKGKELLILYFSASWCPPCKAFSPLLISFYNNIAKEGKLEIVYISSDRSVESFNEYYGKMPFLAVPTDGTKVKNSLAQAFGIEGIPTALVLDAKTGNYITDDARTTVMDAANTKEAGLTLISKWNAMESVPITQAAAKRKADAPKQNILYTMLMAVLKNPVYLVGMLYFYKYFKKMYFPDDDVMVEAGSAEPVPDVGPDDAEF